MARIIEALHLERDGSQTVTGACAAGCHVANYLPTMFGIACIVMVMLAASILVGAVPGPAVFEPGGEQVLPEMSHWMSTVESTVSGWLPGYAYAESAPTTLNPIAADSITDDDVPALVGAASIATFEAGGRTYAAVASLIGIQTLNITDPDSIVAADSLTLAGATSIATFEAGGRTYAAVTSLGDNGVQIIDLSNPYNIVLADSITDDDSLALAYAFKITTFEGNGRTYAAVASSTDDGVQILDVTNPNRIVAAGSITDDDDLALSGATGIVIYQAGGRTYAAVASSGGSGLEIFSGERFNVVPIPGITPTGDPGVQILDITDPNRIVAADSITDDSLALSGARDITTFKGNGRTYAAIASTGDGIQILDITNPNRIVATASITNDDMALAGATSIATFEAGGRTYAAVASYGDDGVQLLDVTDPDQITPAGLIYDDDTLALNNSVSIAVYEQAGYTYAAVTSISDNGVQLLQLGAGASDTGTPDGTPKRTTEINSLTPNGPDLAYHDWFGSSVASLGDLDGDGAADIAVGAIGDGAGGEERGAVHIILLNPDGTPKRTTEINSLTPNGPDLAYHDRFGSSVASLGDLDGDGAADIAVGAARDGAGGENRGAVHIILLNPDGTPKRTTEINSLTPNGPDLADHILFGFSVAGLGDLDGDGAADIAVGAIGDDAGGENRGAVHIILLNPDGTPKRTTEINSLTPNGPDLAYHDWFGWSVASLGDLDGDGAADIAVGAIGDGAGGENRGEERGAIHIILLNPDGTPKRTTEINSLTPNGPDLAYHDRFGSSVASLGDLDGDGAADIAVGADLDGAGGVGRGAVHIILLNPDGTPKRTTEINSLTPNGPDLANGVQFGQSVASLGDLDGDGAADIAVGAIGGGASRGAIHIILLNPDGTPETVTPETVTPETVTPETVTLKRTAEINSLTPNGPDLADGDRFGSSVASLGDLDGDGAADIAVGDIGGGAGRGAVHIILLNPDGTPKRTTEINSLTPNGPDLADYDWFGQSVASLGDLDGDGAADIAVGAARDGAGGENRGAVHIILLNPDGTPKRTTEINSLTPNGPDLADYDWFGSSVASLGDLDGDGAADIAVGAPLDDAGGAGGASRGAVHIILLNPDGTPKRTTEINSLTPNGPDLAYHDWFGWSVASLGDLDGDGAADIAVGAVWDYAGGVGRGAVHIILLNPDGTPKRTTEINSLTPNGPDLADYDWFGSSVASLGDLDGDGAADIAVGADLDGAGGEERGAIHVILLNPDGTPKRTTEINSLTPNGPDLADHDEFGQSVASLGDLDGDGAADIAVGAPGDGGGGASRGAVHIILLNPDGTPETVTPETVTPETVTPETVTPKRTAEINSLTPNGPDLADHDRFGSSVASLGDLDGDGAADIAVGAPFDGAGGAGGAGRGAVHIILLNPDGTPKRTTEINSLTPNGPDLADHDRFGSSVASLGDLDGDGAADIAVGAIGGGAGRGAVHIILLNPDGTPKRTTEINSLTPNGPDLADHDRFGSSVASLGDLDGDGAADIAVGAIGGGAGRGAVHIILLNPDGTPKRTTEINSLTPNGPDLADHDRFGSSVASLGDLDGDGAADIAVGAIAVGAIGDGAIGGGAGRGAVHIILLNPDGTPKRTTEINSLTPNGPDLADHTQFGSSVASLGDLDGDGAADIAVGDIWDDAGGEERGAIHVILLNPDGTPKRTTEINSLTPNGPDLAYHALFGFSVAGLGDLDGDGAADIAVGAPGDDAGGENRGAIHIILLNPDGTPETVTPETVTPETVTPETVTPETVTPETVTPETVTPETVTPKRTAEINSLTPNGPDLADHILFGFSVASLGDLDGDGAADIAVGAARDGAGGENRGAVHIILLNPDGTPKRTTEINSLTPNGPDLADYAQFGSSVASLGDLDGDGAADIAVGAIGDGAGGENRGAIHIILLNPDGTPKRTTEINSLTPNGPDLADYAQFGSSVASLGDLDGDGAADIAVGAVWDDAGAVGRGAVHIILLNPDGTPKRTTEINSLTPNGPDLADHTQFGSSVASLGDLDGDGAADIAVGGAGGAGGAGRGAVHIILLNPDGTPKRTTEINSLTPNGPDLADYAQFGSSVASLGDLDGDGAADIAVGAIGDGAGGENRGAVHIILLNPDGTPKRTTEINSLTPNGPDLADHALFGFSVASLGDLDGDGAADIAVGAPGDDAGGENRGAIHVILLNPDGTP